MSSAVSVSITSTIDRLEAAFKDLATPARRYRAYAAGINWVGDRVITATARYVAAEEQLPVRFVRSKLNSIPAGPTRLAWVMTVSGSYMTLIEYAKVVGGGATQTRAGVRVPRWGLHKGAFVTGVSTGHAGSAHVGVFKRTSSARLPIKQLYGPALPKPLLVAKGREFLEQEIDQRLEPRMAHELGRVVDEVKAAHGV